jgi:nicotinate-nucleotide pyrophosphorylase (carboxylating)
MSINQQSLTNIINLALLEDDAFHDITSDNTINNNHHSNFVFRCKQNNIILCEADIAQQTLDILSKHSKFVNSNFSLIKHYQDGDIIDDQQIIISGNATTKLILAAERTILNLIQHLSGIATSTNNFVKQLNNPNIKIFDTRKTLPGLRFLQKYAVTCGKGYNHRFSLGDQILIKDNHIEACQKSAITAVELAKKTTNITIEVECDNIDQVKQILPLSPNIIMLDNMQISDIKNCSQLIRSSNPNIIIEVSGSININNIAQYSNLDIDRISIGAITHSVKAADISLDFT